VRARRLTWPLYLAITVGCFLAVELLFQVTGLDGFGLIGLAVFTVLMIISDFFTGELPGQDQEHLDG